jgi:hypothetical protein
LENERKQIKKTVNANVFIGLTCNINNEQARYVLSNDKIYFVMIDTRHYDGTYCQIKWYTPITEKW